MNNNPIDYILNTVLGKISTNRNGEPVYNALYYNIFDAYGKPDQHILQNMAGAINTMINVYSNNPDFQNVHPNNIVELVLADYDAFVWADCANNLRQSGNLVNANHQMINNVLDAYTQYNNYRNNPHQTRYFGFHTNQFVQQNQYNGYGNNGYNNTPQYGNVGYNPNAYQQNVWGQPAQQNQGYNSYNGYNPNAYHNGNNTQTNIPGARYVGSSNINNTWGNVTQQSNSNSNSAWGNANNHYNQNKQEEVVQHDWTQGTQSGQELTKLSHYGQQTTYPPNTPAPEPVKYTNKERLDLSVPVIEINGKYYFTSKEDAKKYPYHRKIPYALTPDPYRQRLLLEWVDGAVLQHIVELEDMDISIHKAIIKPGDVYSESVLANPNLKVGEAKTVSVREASRLSTLCQEIYEELLEKGELKINVDHWSKLPDDKIDDIYRKATERITDEMRNKAKSKNLGSKLTVIEENKEITMPVVKIEEVVQTSNYEELQSFAVSHAVTNDVSTAIVVKYEKLHALMKDVNEARIASIKPKLAYLKKGSDKNINSIYGLLNTEDKSQPWVKQLNDIITNLFNEACALHLGDSAVSIDSFIDDYPALINYLSTLEENKDTEAESKFIIDYVMAKLFTVVEPTKESLADFFPQDNEDGKIEILSRRCIFSYEEGEYVYLPVSSYELGLNGKHTVLTNRSYIPQLINEVFGYKFDQGSFYLGTSDDKTYLVFKDREKPFYKFLRVDK